MNDEDDGYKYYDEYMQPEQDLQEQTSEDPDWFEAFFGYSDTERVKDTCLEKRCSRGHCCLITLTPPYFQCSCNHQGEHSPIRKGSRLQALSELRWGWHSEVSSPGQWWDISCSPPQRVVLPWSSSLSLLRLPSVGLVQ
ncbi:hypothetical protein QYF61_012047 [Mycteria americana]|uniref:Uncharacterized protein n=1 Tax=Mycteria americana TaxID=33587 RepID=A0AAN7P473_MYCAM|nr:hypothetical protein QYF61_012047 [Mycteria americana]